MTADENSVGDSVGWRRCGHAGILPMAVVEIPRARAEQPEPPMPVTEDEVIDALRPVEDPELHRCIVDLDMVRRIAVDGDAGSTSTVTLTVAGCPLRNEIQPAGSTAR